MSDWRIEHSTITQMPEVPPEWEDTSWHNDAMPSFERVIDGRTYRLWIDYPTREESEVASNSPEHPFHRFMVERLIDPDHTTDADAYSYFDDFAELEQHLNVVRAGA